MDFLTGWAKAARARVDAENDDIVRVLIGREEKASRWIDAEAARHFAAGRLILHDCEFAAFRVDGKHGDAVVTAIGAINESARGMHFDLGSAVLFGVGVSRQSGNGLKFFERAV